MESRRDFFKKVGLAAVTTAGGVVWTKPNVYADAGKCNNCGYDISKKDQIFEQDIPKGAVGISNIPLEHLYLPQTSTTVCPRCDHWNTYKEFTLASC